MSLMLRNHLRVLSHSSTCLLRFDYLKQLHPFVEFFPAIKTLQLFSCNMPFNLYVHKMIINAIIPLTMIFFFEGMSMEIYAIVNGRVLPYILDPNFEKYLPVIPPDVNYVNFTWKSGVKKYLYNFDSLQSFNEEILKPPVVSISRVGRVPKKAKSNYFIFKLVNFSLLIYVKFSLNSELINRGEGVQSLQGS